MNIVVCIKQTPAPADVRFNDDTRTLVREGVRLVLSSLDRRALLEGLRLRDEVGGNVTVLTMGPPQAESALRECLALGADRAVHLTDRAFGGADTLATSQALAAALGRLSPDLVLCGKFSIDSETSQVPGEVAELLDYPQITSARKIRPTSRPDTLWVERETDDGYEQYEVSLPALFSVTELVIAGRRATDEEMEAAGGKPLEAWSASDLGGSQSRFGAAGSPTWVAEHRSAQLERSGRIVSGEDPGRAAELLVEYLVENGIFESPTVAERGEPRRPVPANPDPSGAVWVVVELAGGRPRPVTHQLLGEAQRLADAWGGEVAAVLVGGATVAALAPELGAHGADTVYVASYKSLESYDTERYTEVLVSAIRRWSPKTALFPSTTNGRDLAPRVAARLLVGLTGDCVGLELDARGRLAQLKPAFGGNVVSPIFSRSTPVMATVRPGMLAPRVPDWGVAPRVETLPVPSEGRGRVRLLQAASQDGLGDASLDDADVVVAVGMGIGGPEGLPMVRELAEAAGGTLAASLRVTAAGWLPPQLQVGLTGKAVAPRFYFAIGVSGQPTHLTGSRKAGHIVAINTDPEAPVFTSANFGVVGDWAQVLPPLTRALRAAQVGAAG